MNKKERVIWELAMDFKNYFWWRYNVNIDEGFFFETCLKMGVENDSFGLKQGQNLESQAAHLYQEFPGVPLGQR